MCLFSAQSYAVGPNGWVQKAQKSAHQEKLAASRNVSPPPAMLPGTDSTYQFACPSCEAVLQAELASKITSVQCGECADVFEVQMPEQCASARCRAASMHRALAAHWLTTASRRIFPTDSSHQSPARTD